MIYPLIWVMAAVLVRVRKLQLLYPRSFLLSVLVGLETIVLQIGAAFWLPGAIGIPLGVRRRCARFFFYVSVLLFLSESEWG